ncbi:MULTISPECIES: GntR family transcriptional regulator [unclassified Halomonas]|jgi:DNA-binding GntR family transcriptional regulator|uniref:GntR family transcriptional regulator n=1 Tax=unclassified Halomonas TaxID=2609666 RepID=UPI000289498E|nr:MULTISPECIES: GntR family transcriptional regulator [unclassified Halomonas]MCE8040248.1 GntR family transcriptional regulator [Halomonas sp. MCCC 1A11062]
MSDAYYLRLTDHLRELLSNPEAFEAGRLPAERTLAERFRTTRVTLRQALAHQPSPPTPYVCRSCG